MEILHGPGVESHPGLPAWPGGESWPISVYGAAPYPKKPCLAELCLLLEICVGLGWEREKTTSLITLYIYLKEGMFPLLFFCFVLFLSSKPHISANIVTWQR